MKFYVAGKWQDRKLVQQVQKELLARGNELTVDWTNHVNPKNDSVLQEWALRDIEGAALCDTYIGVFINDHNYTGALVEMGVALGMGNRVWVIGNAVNSCIFIHHPLVTKFPDVETMLKILDLMPKE